MNPFNIQQFVEALTTLGQFTTGEVITFWALLITGLVISTVLVVKYARTMSAELDQEAADQARRTAPITD